MVKYRKKPAIAGWIEVAYRFGEPRPLASLRDLDPDDYMMVGSPLPIGEFENPYEVYQTLSKEWRSFALPREPRDYDILNIIETPVGYSPAVGTLMLMSVGEVHHRGQTYGYHWVSGWGHALFKLDHPVPSFRLR
jgi:hypothetical protein